MNITYRPPTRLGRLIATSLLCVALFTSACTTTQAVHTAGAADLRTLFQPGDEVACTLTNGDQANLKLTAVEPDAIIADGRRINGAEIAGVQITRFDKKKTTAVAVGVVVGLAAGAAAASSMFSGIKVPVMGHP
jgi:hypothetical protein